MLGGSLCCVGVRGARGTVPSNAKAHPLPPARDAAAWTSFRRTVLTQENKTTPHNTHKLTQTTQKSAKGLSEERKRQRNCQMVSDTVASPAEPWRGLWSQCQGVRDRS